MSECTCMGSIEGRGRLCPGCEAAIRARLALAERVVEAADALMDCDHFWQPAKDLVIPGEYDTLQDALAAWWEGEPQGSLNVAACSVCGGFGGVLLDGPNGIQKARCACGGRKP